MAKPPRHHYLSGLLEHRYSLVDSSVALLRRFLGELVVEEAEVVAGSRRNEAKAIELVAVLR